MNPIVSGSELDEVEDAVPLKWDRFSRWLHCVCVVTFDLELGQALEFKYPEHAVLSDKERSNICYLSFPDSNSGCMGDTQYCFRIRRTSNTTDGDLISVNVANDFPAVLQEDDNHYYGYVYFRQVRDKTLKRGYFQKSVVILSKLPYFNFFKEIAEIVAPEYFDHGEACLETACHDVDQWPRPEPGQTLDLPLVGTVVQVRIPSRCDKPGQTSSAVAKSAKFQYSISSVHEVEVIKYFQPVLIHSHLLWELVLLGEPLVVMSTSPEVCANTVLSLISCISPLRYDCDFRPFFTIHDSEFKEFTSRAQAPPRVLLGVTNPFFTKTLQHWPHIIRIGELGMSSSSSAPSLLSSDKLKKASKMKTFDTKPGVYTEYKMFLKKDKTFFKSLLRTGHRFTALDSVKLRRHFLELTQSFMIPLERYMASLMPLQRNISPLRAPPVLKSFRPEEFLATVDSQGPQLTSVTKGNWSGLYKKFFQSPNFTAWLNSRRMEMESKIAALHLAGLSEMDLVAWCKDKSEVEIVDMILKLREKLDSVKRHEVELSLAKVSNLQNQMLSIVNTLPSDLKLVLNIK
uniref:protein DENND6A-like n=1 Tax=Styela clava TaxID=7725 RepID=UPI00193A6D88|nr:protein DENND6A-like [Styela clava]